MSSLTPLQIELVKTFSRPVSEKQVLEIRQLLADYFAQRLDEAVDKLGEKQNLTPEVADQWLKEPLRTPYKHSEI
jgi:hypothetical protein